MNLYTKRNLKLAAFFVPFALYIIGYFYVNNAFKSTVVSEKKSEQNVKITEEKPVRVTLVIDPQGFGTQTTYSKKMENTNTTMELLSSLRDDGDLFFEIYSLLTIVKLDDINGIKAPEGYMWEVYVLASESDIQDLIENVVLSKENEMVITKIGESGDFFNISSTFGNLNLINNAQYLIKLNASN